MKKRALRSVSLILAVLMCCFLLASCGGNTPAPTQAPAAPPAQGNTPAAPAPAPPPAASGETYDVIVNVTLGEPVSPSWVKLFKELEERSNGQFKITVYWSNSLMSIPEIPKGMASGTATISNLPTPNYPDILPLNCRLLQLPFIGLQDPVESAEIYMQLLDEFPEMIDEYAEFSMVPIAATTLGTYDLHFADKNPVRLPGDMKGRKVVPYKLEFMPLFEANNAAGSYIPPGQMYESLEKAVVDGYVNNWAFQGWFGLTDLVRQHVYLGEYGAFHEFNVIVVNKEFYEGLSADLQKLLVDIFKTEGGYKKMWDDTAKMVDDQIGFAEAKGDLFADLTAEELQVWKDAVIPVNETAIAEINKQRGDEVATKIYNRIVEIIAQKYGA